MLRTQSLETVVQYTWIDTTIPPDWTGPVVGVATKLGESRPFLWIPFPVSMSVDANRDGRIALNSEDDSDVTTAETPFRFWINDDIDRLHLVDGNDFEQDSIGPDEASANNWQADYKSNQATCSRDMEDFSRLWINAQGLQSMLTATNAQLQLGLKWTDVSGGAPAIKIFGQLDTTGGLTYLTDEIECTLQTLEYAVIDARFAGDDPATSTHTMIGGSDVFILPKSLYANLSPAQTQLHLLFEGCTPGKGQLKLVVLDAAGIQIGEGPGVWMDLKNIKDMYEHWSVGNSSGGPPDAVAGRISGTGHSTVFKYDANSPEDQQYILFVHGWNMEQWEKERFAERTFKRLWWQGYKGRFGLFSWSTANNFEGTMWKGFSDGTNFDRSEWTAWRSAVPLRQLMQTLHSAYGGQLDVLSHSMGGVVVSEALRLQSQSGGGQIANVYVASQAAISAHVYDGTLSVAADSPNVVQWTYNHPDLPNGTQTYGPDTPNTVYPFWCSSVLHGDSTGKTSAVGTLVSFYNENDWALAAPRWQFNQITKPDGTNLLNGQPYTYLYDGVLQSFTKTYFYTNVSSTLSLGTSANPQDHYEIMAFAAESYVKALGATPNIDTVHAISGVVNLQSPAIWPTDEDHTAHKWHSAEFRSTLPRQRNYWKTLLGPSGFQINTTTLP